MTINVPSSEKDVARKRRHHKKSRWGCGNCKLRRVKCDETKPRCKKCVEFGVSCDYNSNSSELQPSVHNGFEGAFQVEPLQVVPLSQNQSILTMINTSLSRSQLGSHTDLDEYQLTGFDLDILHKFHTRTILTLGTPKTRLIYQDAMTKIACRHQYLMHMILTLTTMHDRVMSGTPMKQTAYEAYHWYKGTMLFNQKLSQPIDPDERDAIWATAALLGVTAACLDAWTPEEAWPLKPPSALDLDWLRISDGKREIWKLTNPLRPGGVFHAMQIDHKDPFHPTWQSGPELSNLPPEFIDLYNLNPSSTAENNPYHTATAVLAMLMDVQCNHNTILHFLSFIGHIDPKFKQLVTEKEPRALLLMAYWYAKVSNSQVWWIWRRSVIECQSTCLYLEKFHADEVVIQKLLQFPKIASGLSRGSEIENVKD